MLASILIVFALVQTLSAVEILDGTLTCATLSTTTRTVEYTYSHIDPLGLFAVEYTYSRYTSVVPTLTIKDPDSSVILETSSFMTWNASTPETTGIGTYTVSLTIPSDYDGSSGSPKVCLVITSGIVLYDYEPFEFGKQGLTGYDYVANNGRFFRTYLCDNEEGSIVSLKSAGMLKNSVYVNGIVGSNTGATGRPTSGNADESGAMVYVTAAPSPTWIYYGVDITSVTADMDLAVIAQFENATEYLDPKADRTGSLCVYENCHESFMLDSMVEFTDNLTISCYITSDYDRPEESVFRVNVGSVNPPRAQANEFWRESMDNIFTFDSPTWSEILKYVSCTTEEDTGETTCDPVYMSLFSGPWYTHNSLSWQVMVPFSVSYWTDTVVIPVNFGTQSVVASRTATEDGRSVVYSRFLMNGHGNLAAISSTHSSLVTYNYIARAVHTNGSAETQDINIGMWVGADTTEYTSGVYIAASTSCKNYYGAGCAQIMVSASKSSFHWYGLYSADVYGAFTTANPSIDLWFANQWNLDEGAVYTWELSGNSNTDHFLLSPSDTAHGILIFISALDDRVTELAIYASAAQYFPGPNMQNVFSATGTGFVQLEIPAANTSMALNWYITIDTLAVGKMDIQYEASANKNVIFQSGDYLTNTLTDSATIQRYHLKLPDSEERSHVVFRMDFLVTDSSNISPATLSFCVSTTYGLSKADCQSNYVRSVSNMTRTQTNEAMNSAHDWYIIVWADDAASTSKPASYMLYAESYADMVDGRRSTYTIDSSTEPVLLKFTTSNDMDSTLSFFTNTTVGSSRMEAAICSGAPPPSMEWARSNGCVMSEANSLQGETIALLSADVAASGNQWLSFRPTRVKVTDTVSATAWLDHRLDVNSKIFVIGSSTAPYYMRTPLPAYRYTAETLLQLELTSSTAMSIYYSYTSHGSPGSTQATHIIDVVPEGGQKTTVVSNFITLGSLGLDLTIDNAIFFTAAFPTSTDGVTQAGWISLDLVEVIQPVSTGWMTSNFPLSVAEYAYHQYPDIVTACPSATSVTLMLHMNVQGLHYTKIPPEFFTTSTGLTYTWDQSDPTPPVGQESDVQHFSGGIGVRWLTAPVSEASSFGSKTLTDVADARDMEIGAQLAYVSGVTCDPGKVPTVIEREGVVESGVQTEFASLLYAYHALRSTDIVTFFPCSGRPVAYTTYLTPNPDSACATGSGTTGETQCRSYPDAAYSQDVRTPYTLTLTGFAGESYDSPMWWFFNLTDSDAGKADPASRFHMRMAAGEKTTGPIIANPDIALTVKKGGVKAVFSGASFNHDNATSIEYGLYAMRQAETAYPVFDASPYSSCGMGSYGVPIYTKKDSPWVTFKKDTGLKISANKRVDKIDWNSDSAVQDLGAVARAMYNPTSLDNYYITILARELDDTGKVLGWSIYTTQLVNGMKGDLPGIDAWWEILLIVLAVIAVVAALVILFLWVQRRRQAERGSRLVERVQTHPNYDLEGENDNSVSSLLHSD